mgnify:FL=1
MRSVLYWLREWWGWRFCGRARQAGSYMRITAPAWNIVAYRAPGQALDALVEHARGQSARPLVDSLRVVVHVPQATSLDEYDRIGSVGAKCWMVRW